MLKFVLSDNVAEAGKTDSKLSQSILRVYGKEHQLQQTHSAEIPVLLNFPLAVEQALPLTRCQDSHCSGFNRGNF